MPSLSRGRTAMEPSTSPNSEDATLFEVPAPLLVSDTVEARVPAQPSRPVRAEAAPAPGVAAAAVAEPTLILSPAAGAVSAELGTALPAEPHSWARTGLWAALGLGVAVILAAGLLRTAPSAGAPTAAAAAPDAAAAQLSSLASEAARRLDFRAAKAALSKARALAPADPKLSAEWERAVSEAEHQAQLDFARDALAKGDLPAAQAALATMPSDSAFAQPAAELREKLRAAAAQRKPRPADGSAVNGSPVKPKVSHRRASRAKTVGEPAPPRLAAAELRPILDVYQSGDLPAALDMAAAAAGTDASAEQVRRLIAQVSAATNRSDHERAAGQLDAALQSAADAARADHEVSGLLGASVGAPAPLGRSLVLRQVELHRALAQNSWATVDGFGAAERHLRAALSLAPRDPGALHDQETLRARARELYLQGYAQAASNPAGARALFAAAALVLPPGDATGDRARARLAGER